MSDRGTAGPGPSLAPMIRVEYGATAGLGPSLAPISGGKDRVAGACPQLTRASHLAAGTEVGVGDDAARRVVADPAPLPLRAW